MYKHYLLIIFVSFFVATFFIQNVRAVNSNVVISQIQLGDKTSAKNEFVEIYNNSLVDVEITNWCLFYLSSNLTPRELACFVPENDSIHIFLPSYSFALAATNETSLSEPPIVGDIEFSPTLSGTAGYVRLLDQAKTEIDKVGWGTATSALDLVEASPIGKVLSRKTVNVNTLQDSDINIDDFEIVDPRLVYNYGSIYESQDVCPNLIDIQVVIPEGYESDIDGNCSPPPVDVCTNIAGLQIIIPDGFLIDENGDCQIDVCLNINGLQQILPDGMDLNINGDCVEHDECSNLQDTQTIIADGYMRGDDNDCLLDLLPLKITELLPNVAGIDIGKEFIEIHNPNDTDVDLVNYVFYVGKEEVKFFSFPVDLKIIAGQYLVFYNDEIKFTLLNTTSSVQLKSIDGSLIDETPAYDSPKENMAWALIDELWQYTNQPTAGSKNIPTLVVSTLVAEEVEIETEAVVKAAEPTPVVVNELKPCAANQYRSPETNRCRLIPVSDSVLTPCKDGQYRSEETNRCRSIISDVAPLVACSEGKERNPETNRCRSIVAAVLGTGDIKPCDIGQERNPDTNRCRNIISSMPQTNFAPEQTSENSNNNVLWWSLAGVGFVAIVYGVWEWRQEISRLVQKIGLLSHRKN